MILAVEDSDDSHWEQPTDPAFFEPTPLPFVPDVQNMFANEVFADVLVDNDESQQPCIVCLQNVPRFIFRPCGHQCLCLECSAKEDVRPAYRVAQDRQYKPTCYLYRRKVEEKSRVDF